MERTVRVVPEAGLHARPASEFVRTANRYDADLSIGRVDDGDLVGADSMLAVTGLNVAHDESVRLVAEGPDAEAALDALEAVLTTPAGADGEADANAEADGRGDGGDAA